MFSIPPGLKIYLAKEPLDMRKSFDGMAAQVNTVLQRDVFSGHVFVFCNKRQDRLKVLYWDRTGYSIWYKRLEQGRFRLPRLVKQSVAVSPAEFGMLLEGIELTHRQRLKVG